MNPRSVIPVVRILPPKGMTLARPNHLYYNGNDETVGVREAIIALNMVEGSITNQNRYYPIDCASELFTTLEGASGLGRIELDIGSSKKSHGVRAEIGTTVYGITGK